MSSRRSRKGGMRIGNTLLANIAKRESDDEAAKAAGAGG